MDVFVSESEGISVEEAARVLGVSINTIRRRIKQGKLSAEQVARPQGYCYRVHLSGAPGKGDGDGRYPQLVELLRAQLSQKDKQIACLLSLLRQQREV